MTHSLTLKPLPGGDNAPAGTAAIAGAAVQAIGPADLVKRLLPKLSNDELQRLRLDVEAQLRERLTQGPMVPKAKAAPRKPAR
jgi:hypothetical protein